MHVKSLIKAHLQLQICITVATCNECTEEGKSVASKANCAFRSTNEMRKITNVYTRNGVVELKSRLNGKKAW